MIIRDILQKFFLNILWIFFLLFAFNVLVQGQSLEEKISATNIESHVRFLGSDALQGRGTGTIGTQVAAAYLASYLSQYGIQPFGDNQSYFQQIPMHGAQPLPGSKFELISGRKITELVLKRDYLLYQTGAQTHIPQPVELVFVGYGIVAPEFDYNDYHDLNVAGKIVVFLSGEPPSTDSAYFNGTEPTIFSYPEAKQRIAISRGALGSILIPTPRDEQGRNWQYWVNTFCFENITLPFTVTSNLSVVMNPQAAQRLFSGAPYSLRQIFRLDYRHRVQSFPLQLKIVFHGQFKEREFIDQNVIGLLPGQNQAPDDKYIILGAHYDHLGIGRPVHGDSIYNGVLDNAIGVSGLLEIGRVFATTAMRPKYSLIFLFTTGEEHGLLGSEYYLENPAAPLQKTIANINIDGLAPTDTFEDIIGIGAELSDLGKILRQTAEKYNLTVSPIPSQFVASESFARSDQIAFAKAGIPAILIAEGLNLHHFTQEEALAKMFFWSSKIYHSPFDDLNQEINFEAVRFHCEIIRTFTQILANSEETPKWQPGTPYRIARLQSLVEEK